MRNPFLNHARAAVVGAMCLCASVATAGTVTIHVPADEPTIQSAIDVANHGDEIVVAPGTYNEKIDLLGMMIILRSEQGPAETVIDATGLGGPAITMTSGEGMQTIIDGFTVTGGTGALIGNQRYGGGMYITNGFPSIFDCVLTGNSASRGGAVYVGSGAGPWLVDCAFLQNSASQAGGAIYGDLADGGSAAVGAVIVNAWFEKNIAPTGAAVDNASVLTFFDSSFSQNTATSPSGGIIATSGSLLFMNSSFDTNVGRVLLIQEGGGAAVMDSHFENNPQGAIAASSSGNWQQLHIQGTTFRDNSAGSGGAIRAEGKVALDITDSMFEDNLASAAGGAIHTNCLIGDAPICPNINVADTEFLGNRAGSHGGAIATGCASAAGTANCTEILITDSVLSGNEATGYGGAIHNRCVQWIDQESGKLNTYCGEVVVLRSTLIQNAAGQGGGAIANLDESVSVVGDSLLCQNVPEHVLGDWEDEGGNEFTPLADLNCDGEVNIFDLLELLAAWGECDHSTPGACPGDLDINGIVDVFDLLILLAKWGT